MPSPRDPFAIAALVVAGALSGHEFGYLVGSGSGTGHGYFGLVTPLAIAGVVAGMWMSAVSIMRRTGDRAPSVTSLAAAQSALYLGFEIGERTLGSADTEFFSLPVALGLLAQPPVAWLAVRMLRVASSVVRRLLGTAAAAPKPPTIRLPEPVAPVLATCLRSVPARAPPLSF